MTAQGRGAALALIGLAMLAGGLSLQKPAIAQARIVTLQFNGLAWKVETQARDVSELLIQSFGDYSAWTVDPMPSTRLTDNLTITVEDDNVSQLHLAVSDNLDAEIKKSQTAEVPVPPAPPKTAPSDIYTGTATWYDFGGELTTASRQFPKGTRLKVVAVNSGKSVEVVVNDYGPQVWTGVALDLNRPAFAALAPLGAGKIQVKYYKL